MADDNYHTYPEGGSASFNASDWKRAKRAVERMREAAAKRCRHIIANGKRLLPRQTRRVCPKPGCGGELVHNVEAGVLECCRCACQTVPELAEGVYREPE